MSLIVTHPPFTVFTRNPYAYGEFALDMDRFARLIRGELRVGPKRLVTNPKIGTVKKLLAEKLPLALDIETAPETRDEPWTGKDPTRARLRTVGLGNIHWGLSHKWGTNRKLEAFMKKVIENERVRKITQNGLWFDERVLARYGITCCNVVDTREARRAVSSISRLGLGYMATVYDDATPWKEDDEEDDKGLVFTDDYEKLKRYNAEDCVRTARVWQGIAAEPEWKTQRVQKLYKVYRGIAAIAAEMHTTGFRVSQRNRKFMAWCLDQEREEKIAKLVGFLKLPKKWRPSPNGMRELIFARYAVKGRFSFALPDPQDPKMWKEDGISVDKNSLIKLIIDPSTPPQLVTAIELYWEAERAGKWRSTFLTGKKVTEAIGRDGRLRPGWNSCGTDTMRWSCSSPNVMNIPEMLRAYLRASKGCSLVHADKSQFELRMMAAVAQDDQLAANLDTGDVYSADARLWFPLAKDMPVELLKKHPVRKASKIIHLGKQYAAGEKTVWGQALRQDRKMKWTECVALCRAFDTTYWKTLNYWQEEEKRVAKNGYSEDRVLHNRRYYPVMPQLSQIVNYPIQGTAAAIVNLETIEVHKQLRKHVPSAKLIGQLHDALDVDTPNRHIGVVTRIMQDVMGASYLIEGKQHSFPVDIKVGKFWNEV